MRTEPNADVFIYIRIDSV